jgi:hypothetical protein
MNTEPEPTVGVGVIDGVGVGVEVGSTEQGPPVDT